MVVRTTPQKRVRRDYRQWRRASTRFLALCLTLKRSLSNKGNYPDSWWGINLSLLNEFVEKVDALAVASHLASDGGKSLIRDRDKLIEEIMLLLDEIASLLESAGVRNPEVLLNSGFTLTKERRAQSRTRPPLTAPTDFIVVNLAEGGKAQASASPMPGGWNQEVQVNTKSPSSEADWFHKSIFADPSSMIMEDLDLGNNFFRMRHHGPDGAGPWSAIVTLYIT